MANERKIHVFCIGPDGTEMCAAATGCRRPTAGVGGLSRMTVGWLPRTKIRT
jgi:hypothetical protein